MARSKKKKPKLSIEEKSELLKQKLTPIVEEFFNLESPEARELFRPIAIEFGVSIRELIELCQDYQRNKDWEHSSPRLMGMREVLLPPAEFLDYLYSQPSIVPPSEKEGKQ